MGCRCYERLQPNTKEFTRLAYTSALSLRTANPAVFFLLLEVSSVNKKLWLERGLGLISHESQQKQMARGCSPCRSDDKLCPYVCRANQVIYYIKLSDVHGSCVLPDVRARFDGLVCARMLLQQVELQARV